MIFIVSLELYAIDPALHNKIITNILIITIDPASIFIQTFKLKQNYKLHTYNVFFVKKFQKFLCTQRF